MKAKPEPPHHLVVYLRWLMNRLQRWEPDRAAAIRQLVAHRKARIILGDEAAIIHFIGERFAARKASPMKRLPYGITDRGTVVAILAGFLELSDAITEGRLDLLGETDDVIDMCAAVEVIIDASTRIPELQALAAVFRKDPRTGPFKAREDLENNRSVMKRISKAEAVMLQRYGLTF